jgi:hypothetical protein
VADDRLQWNVPAVTAERFDDEIVIVNFDSGKYHSIQGAGVDIWQWLETRPTLATLVELSTTRFGGRAEVESAVREFVADLVSHGLIVAGQADGAALSWNDRDPVTTRGAFEPPVLNTFSDMQELLSLDPIHDVDEAGWPVAQGGAKIEE